MDRMSECRGAQGCARATVPIKQVYSAYKRLPASVGTLSARVSSFR
jgi:hypothetical protein